LRTYSTRHTYYANTLCVIIRAAGQCLVKTYSEVLSDIID